MYSSSREIEDELDSDGIAYALPRTVLLVTTGLQRVVTKRAGLAIPGIDERVEILSSSAASEITCKRPHGLTADKTIDISKHRGSVPDIDGEQTVLAVTSDSSFTIATKISAGGTGGTFYDLQATNSVTGEIKEIAKNLDFELNAETKTKFSIKEPPTITPSSRADADEVYLVELTDKVNDTQLLAKLTQQGVITSVTAEAKRKRLFVKILKTI